MIFVTDNVYLSTVSQQDADDIVLYMRDIEISQNTLRIPFPYTLEDARWWIDDNRDFEEETGVNRNFAIRNESGRMLGSIGVHFNHGMDAGKSEFGYWLGKMHWNKGIMTAAIKKFSELAREKYKMKTLEAHVFSFNPASQKVLLKAGFTQQEYLPHWYKKAGKQIDAVKFAKEL